MQKTFLTRIPSLLNNVKQMLPYNIVRERNGKELYIVEMLPPCRREIMKDIHHEMREANQQMTGGDERDVQFI